MIPGRLRIAVAAVALVVLAGARCGASQGAMWTPEGGWQKAPPQAGAPSDARFDKAFDLYLAGKHKKAEGLFEEIAKEGKEPFAEPAAILEAECALARKLYRRAFDRFEDFMTEYPASRYIDRAYAGEVEIAQAVLAGAKIEALGLRIWSGYGFGEKVVEKVTSRRPLSDFARRAQIALARSYFRRRMYIESASAFQQYAELFPNGPEIEEAMLGIGDSLQLDSPGPGYDPLPCYRAQAALGDFTAQYPSSPRAAKAGESAREVKEKLAKHYLIVGKWYLKKGRLEAAELYFRKVEADYAESASDKEARRYLDSIGRRLGDKSGS